MKKLFIIGIITMFFLGLILRTNIVDTYYSLSNQTEVQFVQNALLKINDSNFEQVKNDIDSNSKLLSDRILKTVSANINKVHLDTRKVARVSTIKETDTYSLIEVELFYENTSAARVRVLISSDKQSGGLKVKDIFFNDAFFIK